MRPSSVTPSIGRQGVEVREVGRSQWRDAGLSALEDGRRFCGAYGSGSGAEKTFTALFAGAGETLALRMAAEAPVPSIVDIAPAADWDEREAHDLLGVAFEGRDSVRPLASHVPETGSWTVPVTGAGTHQVAVGPIHAGVIESGHFRFHVVGERILLLDPHLFYKHRGLERAAEGEHFSAGMRYAQRSCGACAVSNSLAYALACEATLGLTPDRHMRRARTLLAELERLYNHLHDIAAICAGVGFAPGNMAFAALKERALRLNAAAAGHRFLFDTVGVAHSRLKLDGAATDRLRAELQALSRDAAGAWREVAFAASVEARLGGVGELGEATALELGAVGPAARASGVRTDTRVDSVGLEYGSSFTPAVPAAPSGDVAARLEVRAEELVVSFEILDELLSEVVAPGSASARGSAAPIGIARVESPRGETVCAVELDGERIRRLHLRTGSFANWPALAHATAGNLLPDFPLINKSFELCYACVDR